MNYKIVLLPKAQKELFEAWVWYEKQRIGLGNIFEADFYSKAELVQKQPQHYPTKGMYSRKDYKQALLDTFPFIIIYKIIEKHKELYVISVFHTSRHPKRKLK